MTPKTSVPVVTRFYGTGPQFDALALEVDDFSAASRRDSRDAGRFLADVLETQLRHRPLQATGVVLDHHVPVGVGRLRESLSAPVL